MKTNNKNLASTATTTQVTSASNPNLQSASNTQTQTQAPTSSQHTTSTSVTNVSTTCQAKDAVTIKQSMSVSMTSLPSPQHNTSSSNSMTFSTLLQQSTDMASGGNEFLSPNKIVIDRTYNSLKV